MSRPRLLISTLVLGVVIGQLNPLGWIVLRVAEIELPKRKAESLASPTPFERVPREWWVGENDLAFAYENCAPLAPIHLLIVPKERYPTFLETPTEVLSSMLALAKQAAHDSGVSESGFRLLMNTNPDGVQEVYHTHMHLVGGEQLGWPMRDHAWRSVFNTCQGVFDS